MRINLTGQVAMVTGGAKGIGHAISLALASAGADVILVGRDVAALGAAADAIRRRGARAHAIQADVTRETDLATVTRCIDDHYGGKIDIIVTAAGTRDHEDCPADAIDMQHFDAVMRGNLNGSLLPIRAALPALKRRQRGKIITISGVFGLRGRPNHAAGCTSKWAIEGLTRVLALELGPHNINVNAICPGYVEGARADAGLQRRAQEQGTTAEDLRRRLVEATALKRLSTAKDVAHAALFLASDYARNITGQSMVIDAGWTL